MHFDVLTGGWIPHLKYFIPYSALFSFSPKTVSRSMSYPFQKFLDFPSLFLLLYLMFSSFNSSFYAKPRKNLLHGEKEIRGNKRFYFAWKLGRVWCQLPDTTSTGPTLHGEGDVKKSPLAGHPRTCFLLVTPPLSPSKWCALQQITFPDIPLPSL